jgi:DGQHR domain-containing protein
MENNTQTVKFKCLEANQPIGKLYIGVMDYDALEYISFADVRRLELGKDNREVEDYIGIQRVLSPTREKEIGKYVNLIDATFPNSIILAISSKHASYDKETNLMTLTYKDNVAKVLDGQHRIAGLKHCEKKGKDFQLQVSIFIDMELEDQAIVFATINKEQKNVSNSLVADLYDFAKTRSPQKTAHNIARALNRKETSPFYKKIKILGIASDSEKETITQDTFVKSLMKYISKDPQADRDFYKRHKNKRLELISGKELESLIFRNIFIEDETDVNIAQIILNYFKAIGNKWPQAWNNNQPNIILNKSTGFIAFMRLLRDIYIYKNKIGEVISCEEFTDIFKKVKMSDMDFNKSNFIPGSTGQAELYRTLKKECNV